MPVIDHSADIINARIFTTALAPNAAGTGWNYISCSIAGSNPNEWVVLKNFTTTPVEATFTTPTHHYPNSNFQYYNQLRAQNGRIFFLAEDMYVTYYDQTTESIAQIGQLVESPPLSPTVSTIPFSASYDVDGAHLWTSSQESQFRRSCLSVIDTTTTPPTWAVVSYYGSNPNSYTAYGYYTAPDTGTATKIVYGVYGEDPWQLWAINVTPGANYGVATFMTFPGGGNAQVPATGSISFSNIAGQGWAVHFNTDVGHPDNVSSDYWCIDGALVAKSSNISPSPRNVTPASPALVSPPQIDTSAGAGLLNWRPNGSSGDWTQVPYVVTYALPVTIESLAPTNDGILCNGQQYEGFARFVEPADTHTYFGAWPNGVSEPVTLLVGSTVYIAGYPNSVLYAFDVTQPWAASSGIPNPKNLGNFGLTGTQFAGTKYARRIAWAANAGSQGRLFQAGDRERNGNGCGIGSYDKQAGTFAGVYSSADGSTGPNSMSAALTSGLLADAAAGHVVMATKLITPPGSALLYVFDYTFALVGSAAPVAGLSSLGQIFPTSTAHVICGVTQSANGKLALYLYNTQTFSLVSYVETSIAGTPSPMSRHPLTGSVWLFVGNMLYVVDVDTLIVSPLLNVTAQAPIGNCSSFAADQKSFWFNGGAPSGVSGAELYSFGASAANANLPRRLARRRSYTP